MGTFEGDPANASEYAPEACSRDSCVEVARSGGHVYLIDTKDLTLGPLAIYSLDEYAQRVHDAYWSRDPLEMFATPEQHNTLTDEEIGMLGSHIGAMALQQLADGGTITAYGDGRLLREGEPQEIISLAEARDFLDNFTGPDCYDDSLVAA
jgi:hypothetical protein